MSNTYRRRPLFAAGFLLVAACSRFDEALSAEDGGPTGVDAGEAGPGPGAEAGPDVPIAPGAPFCSIPRPGQLFCEDFETDKPKLGFTDRYEEGAVISAMRLNAGAERGFVLAYQANAGVSVASWLRFASDDPAGRDLKFRSVKLMMDVAIGMQSVSGLVIAGIWVNPLPAAAPIVHGLALHGMPLELQGSQDGAPMGRPQRINLGDWQTITIELALQGPTTTRRVSIGSNQVDTSLVSMPADGEWDVRIGAYYGSVSSLTMLIDNVVVTRE